MAVVARGVLSSPAVETALGSQLVQLATTLGVTHALCFVVGAENKSLIKNMGELAKKHLSEDRETWARS